MPIPTETTKFITHAFFVVLGTAFTVPGAGTASASAKLREAGRKSRQQKAVIDQAAAVEILNAWMGD
jgi:RNase H-fold protein (predicted Holliday junction resolvase)